MKKLYGVIANGRLLDVSHSTKALMRRWPARIVYNVRHVHSLIDRGVRSDTYQIGEIARGPESPTISLRHIGKQLAYTRPAHA